MDKLVIEIFPEQIQVYKINNENKEIFYIQGEEYFYWNVSTDYEDFEKLKNEILDILNLGDFGEIALDIIYENIDSESIKNLSQVMLPCAYWQVFDKEKDLHKLKILDMHREQIENQESLINELSNINKQLNKQVSDLWCDLIKANSKTTESSEKVNKITMELNDYKDKIGILREWTSSNLEEEYITKEKVVELGKKIGIIKQDDVINEAPQIIGKALSQGVSKVLGDILKIYADIGKDKNEI